MWMLLTISGLAVCVLLYWYRAANRETIWVKQPRLSGLPGKRHEHTDPHTGEKDIEPEKAPLTRQPLEYFLVLDVEATCVAGTDFNWPNEIIEWPVVLLTWDDRDEGGRANLLKVIDEFRSFVRPTWKPRLSEFCTSLTGITQDEVDSAPIFSAVLDDFRAFLCRHGLICSKTGQRLRRFTWATDGPFDIRDFVVKQCFISKVRMPEWLRGDVVDVRREVAFWLAETREVQLKKSSWSPDRSLNITRQLAALSLPPFQGRQHSGIDDTRNIARVLIELARRGVRLEPNLRIHPERRWYWMGTQPGEIYEEYFS